MGTRTGARASTGIPSRIAADVSPRLTAMEIRLARRVKVEVQHSRIALEWTPSEFRQLPAKRFFDAIRRARLTAAIYHRDASTSLYLRTGGATLPGAVFQFCYPASSFTRTTCNAFHVAPDIQGFSVELGSSAGVGLIASSDVALRWNCVPRRLAPRALAAPTGAGTARNSARLNFGFMENMVIK